MINKKIMEQWEKDYRELLDKEIPQGSYEIGVGKFIAWTGKGGYIDYLVEIKRHYMEMYGPETPTPEKQNEPEPTNEGYLQFKKLVGDVLWGRK